MPHSHHPTLPARRIVAALACTLLAAIGLTTATGTSASAEPAGADSRLTVTWTGFALKTDLNSNGRPDPLDTVTITGEFTAADSNVFLGSVTGANFIVILGTQVRAGETKTISRDWILLPANLDGAGNSGPYLGDLSVNYYSGLSRNSLTATPPGPLYTAGPELLVATALDVVENGGTVPGQVVERDTVGYTTTLTNTTPRTMTITSMPGYDDFPGSATIPAGASATFIHHPQAVTYDNMAAGAVTFPPVSITWSAAYDIPGAKVFQGSVTASYDPVATEPINAFAAASVRFVVHSQLDGTRVPLGDAQPGDVIDVVFDATNMGNVTLNYVSLAPGSWGGAPVTHTDSALTPGAALPTGTWKPKELKSAGNGVFDGYVLTSTDIADGYVDLGASLVFAPHEAAYQANPGAYTYSLGERVYLRNFTTRANLAVTAEFNDTNGDGVGQAGETVRFRVRLKNNANQDLTITGVTDLPGSDVVGGAAGVLTGATVLEADAIAKGWNYVITAADEARGTLSYGADVTYVGVVNGEPNSRNEWAPQVPTGAYVAPTSTLTASGSYVDTNLDGYPSLGETVTLSVTVANVGAYDLTGLAVADAGVADVTGLLPAFPSTIAAGGSSTQSFTSVLTAADFDRGTFTYAAQMTADGLADPVVSNSAVLTGITFVAYASDLDPELEGDIAVCTTGGAATTSVTNGTPFKVMPQHCGFTAPPTGYRVVMFSDPMVLAVGAFTVSTPPLTAVGAHRIALYAPDGSLVGWRAVTVSDPIVFAGSGDLALTGADARRSAGTAGGAAALVLLGAAAVFLAGRRRRGAVG